VSRNSLVAAERKAAHLSSKLQATLLIVIAVGVALDAAYSRWTVAGAVALLAFTMLSGSIKADRVTITSEPPIVRPRASSTRAFRGSWMI
jgi:hypothetical protein